MVCTRTSTRRGKRPLLQARIADLFAWTSSSPSSPYLQWYDYIPCLPAKECLLDATYGAVVATPKSAVDSIQMFLLWTSPETLLDQASVGDAL